MKELQNVQVTQEQLNDGANWLLDTIVPVGKEPDKHWSEISEGYAIPDGFPLVSEIDRSDSSEINIARAKKALQFTGIRRYLVCYSNNGRHRKSPWFKSERRAHQALAILKAKGYRGYIFAD